MLEYPELVVYGVNHETAAIEIREKAAFTVEEIPFALKTLLNSEGIEEGVILSTCNRCEIYVIIPQNNAIREKLDIFFLQTHPALSANELAQFYYYEGYEAIKHLFSVASGLNSMVIGEPQILGQVKDAFNHAFDTGATGIYLNRLFQLAFQTAKQVRTETAITEGAVSVSFAAVKMALKIFKDLRSKRALLIGSGETGELVAQNLKKFNIGKLLITNRTLEKAEKLANRLGGEAYPFDRITTLLNEVDLVVGATGSPDYVVTANDVKQALSNRDSRPLFMIDIAVPRDFDPEINRINNVFLSDIDALKIIVESNLEKRHQAVSQAQVIIEAKINEYQQWKNSLEFKPTIISLRNKLQNIREDELARHCRHATPDELATIERVTQGLLNKILALPMLKIHDCSTKNGESKQLIKAIHHIFDLETDEHV